VVLAGDASSSELAELVEEIGTAAGSLIDRWPRLERNSPYRLASLDEAIILVSELIELGRTSGDRSSPALLLEGNLSVLVAAQARALLSERLSTARGSRSIRSVSKGLHLALGYLSDLESGRTGPPSAAVLEKLATGLDIDLSDVSTAKIRAEQLKHSHRRHVTQTRRTYVVGGMLPGEDTRPRALGAATDDPQLLDLIDAIRQLPVPLRQVVAKLAKDLKAAWDQERRPRRGP
jgi:transcriptional regulator with XRE-family HTH domain